MSRRGDNIRRRKDGRWAGRYLCSRNPDGKGIYRSVYGKTYAQVKEKLNNKTCNSQKSSCANNEITVNNIAEQWLQEIKLYKNIQHMLNTTISMIII